jgi:CBS domain-containing protein
MYVQHAMSTSVVVVKPQEPAARAADLLVDRSLIGLPVVDNDGHAVGVLSDVDLISALRPVFVHPETDLEAVVDLMEHWRVRRLPVCERGRVVGVISRGDVLRALHAGGFGTKQRALDCAT